MPQILVVTDSQAEQTSDQVVYRERISATDLESAHFSDQLVERVGWAVHDANELERKDRRLLTVVSPESIPAARRLSS